MSQPTESNLEPRGSAVFLDTTIQIARVVHSPETKARIEAQLREYDFTVTSLGVRQEFKRRLLREADYLLRKFVEHHSFERVMRDMQYLPPQQVRKKNICLDLLSTIDETDGDADRADRAILILRELLLDGLADFDDQVGQVVRDSGCGCAIANIRRDGSKFTFGPRNCSECTRCGVTTFFTENSARIEAIANALDAVSEKDLTTELKTIRNFAKRFLASESAATDSHPCLKLGDLLIALESAGIPTFYTMNSKESRHLCPALQQRLVVRRHHPKHDDEVVAVQADTKEPPPARPVDAPPGEPKSRPD